MDSTLATSHGIWCLRYAGRSTGISDCYFRAGAALACCALPAGLSPARVGRIDSKAGATAANLAGRISRHFYRTGGGGLASLSVIGRYKSFLGGCDPLLAGTVYRGHRASGNCKLAKPFDAAASGKVQSGAPPINAFCIAAPDLLLP